MAKLEELKVARKYVKSAITRIETFCNSERLITASLEAISEKKHRLIKAFHDYEQQNQAILYLDPSDSEDYAVVEDKHDACLELINKRLAPVTSVSEPSCLGSPGASQASQGKFKQLPPITLNKYDGKNIMDYHPFINMFKAVIHSDVKLSSCEKLYYLRSYLLGEALDLIKHLMLDDDNYEVALKLLEDRYDNKPKIVNFHVNSIVDMPSFTKCTAFGLRSLISNVNMHLAALKNLGERVEFWDTLLVNILSKKIDSYTLRGFYFERNMREVPKLCEFLTFLENRAIALESTAEESHKPMKAAISATVATGKSCKYCHDSHKIYECVKFKMLSHKDRSEFVNINNLCKLCLNNHQGRCMLKLKCATCHQFHNTLLHLPAKSKVANATYIETTNEDLKNISCPEVSELSTKSSSLVANLSAEPQARSVLLPTAMVKLKNKDGSFTQVRALLDSASQVSFICGKILNNVDSNIYKSDEMVTGVCNGMNNISQKADILVHSSVNDFKINVTCCVTKSITCPLPQQTFDMSQLNIPSYVKLADENFNQTDEIGMLLGCDVFFKVLQRESLPLAPSGLFLVNTSFGYVVAGTLPISAGKIFTSNYCVTAEGNPSTCKYFENELQSPFPCGKEMKTTLLVNDIHSSVNIDNLMSKFWECEKVPDLIKESDTEQQLAEEIFQQSVKLENSKFTVALPVKVGLEKLDFGDSFSSALQRFYNLEKRFSKDVELHEKYKKFIHDYIDQGHAKYFDISNYNLKAGNVMFLPHHPVINPNSKTTPVRSVFDGGAVTKNNLCLNDVLLNGAVVQRDLFDILILFRTFKYVILCDVKAMYRQIFIEEKYRCLQNILWRDSPDEPVKCVQLQTVTYGLKSSAFLATRCLIELAHRYKDQYPLASFVLMNTTYVDDIQCGSNDLDELYQIKKELIEIMKLASLSLHKWCSNHQDILSDIPVQFHQFDAKQFDKNIEYVKTLGLSYDVTTDTLNMQCPVKEVPEKFTKRQMFSWIGKFFDPLGLCGPIIVLAKISMRDAWFESLKWDDFLPSGLNKKWVDFANSLVKMSCISMQRNINAQKAQTIELVGFCDASNVAHGCCLYLRVIDLDGNISVNLLCSKSRINPKDKNLSTPRLELNGALLLAILAKKVHTALSLKYSINTYLYTDSMIVLAWLKILPLKLNMYVGNRVDKINKLASDFQWHYVNTNNNPADLLSRGVEPQALEACNIWWHGPTFLSDPSYCHKVIELSIETDLPELKSSPKACNISVESNTINDLMLRHSNIDKLTRIMSFILRFVHNCKNVNSDKKHGHLSPQELNVALRMIIKCEQRKCFQDDIANLKNKLPIKSGLNSLHPFLDAEELLRLGGRLQNANIPFSQKHPIILPKGSHITKMIIQKEHLRLKHAGNKLLLSSLNEQYWIINANREIKAILYKCIQCFRLKSKNAEQLMGSLPIDRVNMTRPFQIVGTDYAGPFYVKQTRIRNPVITKAYVVIFVCFVTKAVHIELASDMTTNTFLGCLKRFIARRNKPTKIYCDNAAYYKGAENELNKLYDLHNSISHQTSVVDYASSERIAFHFIPSYSPVFGGLWEAGVKSIKYHMKRVIGKVVLTYEEMYTVIVQIESILNSRPLTPMSRNSDDMTYLTPAHFLTGSSLSSYPEPNLINVNIGRLSFWKQCVQLQQHFWQQWHKQYLVMLQSRPKWKNESPNVKIGTLVLLREDNVTPLCWPVGRIVDVQPGKDGRVRALHVKTAKGSIVKTSILKVSPLPIDYD